MITDQQIHEKAIMVADAQWNEEFPLISSMESPETFRLWTTDFYTVALKLIILDRAGCL